MLVLRGYSKLVGYLLMALGVFIILGPFLWVTLQSFKYEIEILKGSWFFEPTTFNYQDVLWSRRSDFLKNVTNSAIVAAAISGRSIRHVSLGCLRGVRRLLLLIAPCLLVFGA